MTIRYAIILLAAAFAGSAMAGSPNDAEFAKKAAQGGMAEVALGRLAQTNGQSEDVKAFGRRMVKDHSKANEELKTAAKKEGVDLPTHASEDEKEAMQRLSKLDGAAFDEAYAKMMVEDHEKDVAEFREESKSDAASAISAFATKALPTLEEHLRMARKLEGSASSGSN